MPEPIPYFDGHNDVLLRLYLDKSGGSIDKFLAGGGSGHVDLPRARQGSFVGGLFATFSPPLPRSGETPAPASPSGTGQRPLPPQLAIAEAQASILGESGILFRLIAASDGQLALCRTVGDIRTAIAEGRIAMVFHMEGADALDEDLYVLDLLCAAGLRSLGPVWSRANIFGTGVPFSFPGTPDVGPGLTDAGKRLIAECNRRRVLVDLSHMNEAGFWDIATLSTAPLVASHSNAHALCPSPRNLTDRQLDAIRDSGGFVGLNFATCFLRPDGAMRADTDIALMAQQLDYLIAHLGEDHVGLGSDFDGATVPAAIGSVGGTQALFDALRAHGYDEPMLRKIGAENWLAVLTRTWGA